VDRLATAVLEMAVLDVRSHDTRPFEAAFEKAQSLLTASPGYRRHELRRCAERPNRYLLLVWWDSLESHTEGFRESPAYAEWSELLHRYYDPFPTVMHFEPPIAGAT
jgi:heme-degrading monooxygenase HmoA